MLYFNLKLLIIIPILLIIFKPTTVHSKCEIYVDKESGVIPRFDINIGETVVQKNLIKNKFEILDDVEVTGYCETSFSGITDITNNPTFTTIQQVIKLHCFNGDLYLGNDVVHRPFFACSTLNWNIFYAHNEQFHWCDNKSNATTMFIMSKVNNRYIALAKICYDFKKNHFRSISYNAQYSGKTNGEMIKDMNVMLNDYYEEITDDLRLLRSQNNILITNELLQQNIMNLSKSNILLSFANYEIRPLVQGKSYAKYLNEFHDFLNTIWWHNLRVGNWKLFIDTLETNAHNNTFRLISGSLGKLEIPRELTSKQSEILELKFESKFVNIPAYIWSYVKSMDGSSKDFFIFGYNSPYAEFFSLDDIKFCPDICSEVPWLQDVYASFRYRLMGLIFCCYSDSVKDLDIDGVKVKDLMNDLNEIME